MKGKTPNKAATAENSRETLQFESKYIIYRTLNISTYTIIFRKF